MQSVEALVVASVAGDENESVRRVPRQASERDTTARCWIAQVVQGLVEQILVIDAVPER